RGNCQNEQEHNLAIRLAPARACHNKGQPGGVQHDLDRHQSENQISSHQNSDQAQCEENSGQHETFTQRDQFHHLTSGLEGLRHPRWYAPTSPPSSRIDANSTPIRYGPNSEAPTSRGPIIAVPELLPELLASRRSEERRGGKEC